jgi:hypothetical protein
MVLTDEDRAHLPNSRDNDSKNRALSGVRWMKDPMPRSKNDPNWLRGSFVSTTHRVTYGTHLEDRIFIAREGCKLPILTRGNTQERWKRISSGNSTFECLSSFGGSNGRSEQNLLNEGSGKKRGSRSRTRYSLPSASWTQGSVLSDRLIPNRNFAKKCTFDLNCQSPISTGAAKYSMHKARRPFSGNSDQSIDHCPTYWAAWRPTSSSRWHHCPLAPTQIQKLTITGISWVWLHVIDYFASNFWEASNGNAYCQIHKTLNASLHSNREKRSALCNINSISLKCFEIWFSKNVYSKEKWVLGHSDQASDEMFTNALWWANVNQFTNVIINTFQIYSRTYFMKVNVSGEIYDISGRIPSDYAYIPEMWSSRTRQSSVVLEHEQSRSFVSVPFGECFTGPGRVVMNDHQRTSEQGHHCRSYFERYTQSSFNYDRHDSEIVARLSSYFLLRRQ